MDLPVILDAFTDNYIYLLEYAAGKAVVVDPGDASVVRHELIKRSLTLTHIIATHHHADHIGGIDDLKQQFASQVISGDPQRICATDTAVADHDVLTIGPLKIRVLATPGHTRTGVCYEVIAPTLPQGVLFTGDTLFVCGCGRLFECDAQTLFDSLSRLRSLPDETLVYPGHNYTQENLRFALTVAPGDRCLQKKRDEAAAQDRKHVPTVPSRLQEEKQLNPFMRAETCGELGRLRKRKDDF